MTSHWLSFGLALVALGQSGSSAMVQTAAATPSGLSGAATRAAGAAPAAVAHLSR